MTTERDLASLLPPALREGLVRVCTDVPEQSGVGYGFASDATSGPVDIMTAPQLWTTPKLERVAEGTVRRWQPRPTTIVVDSPTPPTALVGEPHIRDGRVLQLDAATERFVLLFRHPDEDVVLDVRPGGVLEEWRRPRNGDAPFVLPPLAERPRLALPAADLSTLDALELDEWLIERATALAAATGRGPALAVGLVLRLGRPSSAARPAELERMRSGQEPTTRVWARAWASGVNSEQLEVLRSQLRESASSLLQTLDRVSADPTGELDDLSALDLVTDRDDLESGRALLHLTGGAEHLTVVLEAVDRRALELGAALADALPTDALDPDWRDAVSWQEPRAWWAQVGPE